MFADASALVAILGKERDWRALGLKLEQADSVLVSAMVVYEATLGISRLLRCSVADARDLLDASLTLFGAETVPIDGEIGAGAVEAFARYGKGRHKAKLNMGDCFAYACAKAHRVPLLFKGSDFTHTDIEVA